MPYPRTPTNVLRLNGSGKAHSARLKARENEVKDARHVKELRARIDTERKAYNVLVGASVPGVLGLSDSPTVWLACKLMVRIDSGNYTTSDAAQFKALLMQLGMTPAARAGLRVDPDNKTGNPFDNI